MKRIFLCFVFLSFMLSVARAQNAQEEETKEFILKVVSSYKNPLAYYPLNRDLFLPDQAEIDSINGALDRYSSPHLMYKILFDNDDSIKRETFLNASGQPLFQTPISRFHSSKSNDFQFFKRKQDKMLSSTPNLGRFLLYNRQFKESGDSQNH